MTIVNVLIKWSLRGAKRRACALKRYDAQAWQSLRLLPCLPAGRASLAMTIYDVASTFSILTAQTLNSGIFAMGSKAGLVNLLAALLTKWKGMKIVFLPIRSLRFALILMTPLLERTLILSPWIIPNSFACLELISANPSSTSLFNEGDLFEKLDRICVFSIKCVL